MNYTIEDALHELSTDEAKIINEKHKNTYILHYYAKAKAHEKSGKMKGDFPYYFKKLLTQDKSRFYEKEDQKVVRAQKEADKVRKARLKVQMQLEETKNRETMASAELQTAKDQFRKLPEVEQNRRIKREVKKNPHNSFNQNRDLAVISFHKGK
jgi:hypothetical protein